MTNNNNSYGIFESIGTIIGASIFTGVCGWIFIKAADSENL